MNIFDEKKDFSETDNSLVEMCLAGNRKALEELILRHQAWIYNIALRMCGKPVEAQDITQEILLKIITKLSTFNMESSFRTWVYRITANHVLNMKKSFSEKIFNSFESHEKLLHRVESEDDDGYDFSNAELGVIVEETKIQCLYGMLLCLTREQRLIFILGGILGISSEMGSAILDISRENFRKKLSRARQELNNYMNGNCSLVDSRNSCRCARKTKGAIKAGYVSRDGKQFTNNYRYQVKEVVGNGKEIVDEIIELSSDRVYRDMPFSDTEDPNLFVERILQNNALSKIISFS